MAFNKSNISVVSRLAGIGAAAGILAVVAVLLFNQMYAPPHDQVAFIKWGNAPAWSAPGWYDRAAAYDYAAFTPGVWDGHQGDLDSLLLRNADFMAGTYFSTHSVPEWMANAGEGSYPRALYDALISHVLPDTLGNPASVWPNTVLYDFTDPNVQRAAGALLADYVRRNHIDWVFLDYCSATLPPAGLAIQQAPDYREQMVAAWTGYMGVLRELVPPAVKLIPNGSLALRDSSFARLADGCFVEDFPRYFFGTVGPNWNNALDPDYLWSLFPLTQPRYREGVGVVMIGDDNNEDWTADGPLHQIDQSKFPGLVICYTQKADGLPPAPFERE